MTTITYLNTIHVQYSLRSVLAHGPQHACLRCISIQHGVLLLSHISKSYETRIKASSASVNMGFPKLFFNTFYSEKNTLTSSSETVGTASEISECRHTGPHVYSPSWRNWEICVPSHISILLIFFITIGSSSLKLKKNNVPSKFLGWSCLSLNVLSAWPCATL